MNFEPMKPDHTTPQGPGSGLTAGKRSLLALVCALVLVALSACNSGGKPQVSSDSAAALIPAEALLVAGA